MDIAAMAGATFNSQFSTQSTNPAENEEGGLYVWRVSPIAGRIRALSAATGQTLVQPGDIVRLALPKKDWDGKVVTSPHTFTVVGTGNAGDHPGSIEVVDNSDHLSVSTG